MPLDLRTYAVSGSFNTTEMDQNWLDIQGFVNGLETAQTTLGNSLTALDNKIGTPVLFGVSTLSVVNEANLDFILPDAATWDELQFHIFLQNLTVAEAIGMRFSYDGGATFDSGANNYASSLNGAATSNANMVALGANNSSVGWRNKGIATLYKTMTDEEQYVDATFSSFRTAAGSRIVKGYRNSLTGPCNAVRFLATGGNITGRVSMLRVKFP